MPPSGVACGVDALDASAAVIVDDDAVIQFHATGFDPACVGINANPHDDEIRPDLAAALEHDGLHVCVTFDLGHRLVRADADTIGLVAVLHHFADLAAQHRP